MNEEVRVLVSDGKAERLDVFIAHHLPELSRTRVQYLIRLGMVSIDGVPVTKSNHAITLNARVMIIIPQAGSAEIYPEAIPLDVIFENEQILVVNKPAGMVVHPSAGHDSGTLVNAVLAHAADLSGIGGVKRPGIVHRLDKETSGIIIVAKNDQAHRRLVEKFKTREIRKEYIALVDGSPPTPTGRIETAIGRDPKHRKRMAVVPDTKGRSAVTEYATLHSYLDHTLIKAKPLTGRTHQIRVHLAFLGCPVVGDRIYGKKSASIPIERHFLHASKIIVQIPGEKEEREFVASLPEDLSTILEELPNAK